jgi:hypothetical protein
VERAEVDSRSGSRPTGAPRTRYGRWRATVRRTPGGAALLKAGVFLLGAVFIGLGLAAAVLPGPLTIPPVLLGLWIWASEFSWADALLHRAQDKGRQAWEASERRPVVAGVTTVGGLVAAGAVIWAVHHFSLVAQVRDAVGL